MFEVAAENGTEVVHIESIKAFWQHTLCSEGGAATPRPDTPIVVRIG